MHTTVKQGKQIVRYDTFYRVVIAELEAHPQALDLGPGKKNFSFGLELVGEFPDEVNAANVGEGNIAALALRGQEADRFFFAQH